MKIAVLGLRGFPGVLGGVENHCEHLYPGIVRMGGEVTVFTRNCHADPARREYRGVRLVPLPCPRRKSLEALVHTFLGVFRAWRLRPDILHIHAVGPSLFVPLARFLGMRVVMTNHGPDYERKKWGWPARAALRMGERLGSRYAQGIVCVAPHIAERVRDRFGREALVIPNGIAMPPREEDGSTLERFGLRPGKYILSVGRFVPEKGFDYLIEAFSRVHPDGWKLAIAGRADHEDDWSRALVRRAEAEPGVVLTGFLTGKPLRDLYRRAGLFVLPSFHEGLPIVLLEAMSHGLSCVVSDIPANRGVSLPDERYVPPGNISELVEKLARFTAEPFGDMERERQRAMVRNRYDWDDIARRTLALYQAVMEPSGITGRSGLPVETAGAGSARSWTA